MDVNILHDVIEAPGHTHNQVKAKQQLPRPCPGHKEMHAIRMQLTMNEVYEKYRSQEWHLSI